MSAWPGSEQAISVGEAAQLTGASSKSLRRRIERGTLGSVRQGGRRLIPISELVRVGLLAVDAPSPAPAGTGAPAYQWSPTPLTPAPDRFAPGGQPAPPPMRLAPTQRAMPPAPAASPPEVRAPWSADAVGTPRRPSEPRYVATGDVPAARPAEPVAQPAPASPGGLTHQDRRRLSAMVELVMHQTRTINSLTARLAELEGRVGELEDELDDVLDPRD